jgi:hypothetical protein
MATIVWMRRRELNADVLAKSDGCFAIGQKRMRALGDGYAGYVGDGSDVRDRFEIIRF